MAGISSSRIVQIAQYQKKVDLHPLPSLDQKPIQGTGHICKEEKNLTTSKTLVIHFD